MKIPLYFDEKDPKWILLLEVLKIFDYRRTHQELAKNGITPLNRSVNILKIVMIAFFFNTRISFVVHELNRNPRLQNQLKIDRVYSTSQVYEFLSRFNEELFYEFTIKLLNHLNFKNTRGIRNILVDGTDIQLDLNWFGRKISKKSLEKKPYKWGFSSSKGYYIGLKLTLAIDCKTMQPIAMLLHEGTPNDAKIFDEIMEEMQNRRIIRKGDKLFFDKGYFSKDNYQLAIIKYKTISLIFPRGKNPVKSVFDNLSHVLDAFYGENNNLSLYKSLAKKAKEMLENWKDYKGIRSKIEDFNKLLKEAFSLRRIHHYTRESIHRTVWLNVLLAGIITSLGIRKKKDIQRLTEM